MDQKRFTLIAHGDLEFWNPVSSELMDRWIDELPLSVSSRVLDVGCGRGEFLLRTVKRFDCKAIGVDRLGPAVAGIQKEAAHRFQPGQIEVFCETFDPGSYEPGSFDLAVCIGSTHAISNLPESLRVLSALVKPGGILLVGDGFWEQSPDRGYLDFLGAKEDELLTHEGNIAMARELGLELIRDHKATPNEWSHYEDTYAANVRAFVAANPEDPDAPGMKGKIEAWRDAYLKWGKATLGFGLYLFQTPSKKA